MEYIVKEKLYSDIKCIKYLRENSHWYKKLNRGVPLEIMIDEMKERYGLRFRDKVEKVGTGLDLINAFMDATKE